MINSLFWNIRGLSKPSHFRRLRKIILQYHIQFLIVCKTRVNISLAENFRQKLHFDSVVCNSSGSLWLFYNGPVSLVRVGEGEQHFSFRVLHSGLPTPLTVSFVHAFCSADERRALWDGLLRDKPVDGPWLVGGDFNVVVDGGKRREGGRSVYRKQLRSWILCPQRHCLMLDSLGLRIPGVITGMVTHVFGSVWIGF